MGTPKGKTRINVNDIIGKRLGKLEIVCYAGRAYDNTRGGQRMRHYYSCKCDCGETYISRRAPLKNDKVHSCGCIKRSKKNRR